MLRLVALLALAALLAGKHFQEVTCTVYSSHFDGRHTASGATYRHNGLSVAVSLDMRYLLGHHVTVTVGNRSLRLPVTDLMGPRARKHIDLSGRAWRVLTSRSPGKCRGYLRR